MHRIQRQAESFSKTFKLTVIFSAVLTLAYFVSPRISRGHVDLDFANPSRLYCDLLDGAFVDWPWMVARSGKSSSWVTPSLSDGAMKNMYFANVVTETDVSRFLPSHLRLALQQSGTAGLMVLHVPPAWNLITALLLCEANSWVNDVGACNPVLPLIDQLKSGKNLLHTAASSVDTTIVRSELAHALSRPNSLPVNKDRTHPVQSAVLISQLLCTSKSHHLSLDFVGQRPLPTFGQRRTEAVYQWNEIVAQKLDELQFQMKRITESEPNVVAEELLLQKIKMWNPFAKPNHINFEQNAFRVLFRPTILCSTLTGGGEGLRLALLQHLLWGYQCDRHIIFVGNDDDGSDGPAHDVDVEALIELSGIKKSNIVYLKIPERLIHIVNETGEKHPTKPNMWQRFREATEYISTWSDRQRFQYFYFVSDDVYVIPENLYGMLMLPEYVYPNAIGTPLYIGNRMLTKDMSGNPLPYVNSGAGFILNEAAQELLASLFPLGDCHEHAPSPSVDELLALCLSRVGVVAKDTTDELGEDRFHVLPMHWLLLSTSSTDESWWYLQHRAKSMDEVRANPFRLISSTTIAFGRISSAERAFLIHKQLRE